MGKVPAYKASRLLGSGSQCVDFRFEGLRRVLDSHARNCKDCDNPIKSRRKPNEATPAGPSRLATMLAV